MESVRVKIIRIGWLLGWSFGLMLMTGCQPLAPGGNGSPDRAFADVFPVAIEDWNESIRVTLPEEFNPELKIGETLDLLIENTTDTPFRYPNAEGPLLFALEAGDWVPLENLVEYVGSTTLVVLPHDFLTASVLPFFEQLEVSHEVRIALHGELLDENGGVIRPVGAYIDAVIEP